MVSPYLNKKQEDSLSLEHSIRKLFQVVYREQKQEKVVNEDEAKIRVSDLISKMAFYYEKIRNAVDYNEEHLHRKDAIVRILKRQIVIEGIIKISKSEEIASNLLHELIRGGYLPNNTIPEKKIDEVAEVFEKHINLRNKIIPKFRLDNIGGEVQKMVIKEKREMGDWLIGLMASEVESILETDKVREIVVSNMYEYLVDNIKLPTNFSDYEKDLKLQVYLAVFRNYLKYDKDMLNYLVFKYYNAEWWMPKESEIEKIAHNVNSLRKVIERQVGHPLVKQLDKHIGRYTVYYQTLVDMIAEDPAGLYEKIKTKPDTFPSLVKKTFNKRYESTKKKLWRSGINSMMYILITRAIFAVLREIPVNKYFGEEHSFFSLVINVTSPSLLLFFVILFTKVSSEANNKKIVEGVSEITFAEKKRTEPIVLRKPGKRGGVLRAFFGLFYVITYFISFGIVVAILKEVHFGYVDIVLFLIFLAFVSFFAIRIRRSVRQLIVVEEKENIITFLIDFLFMPIVAVGKWLSSKFSRINVFVFILDFIIEAPFKVFVEIAEQWTRYVKERKDDIV